MRVYNSPHFVELKNDDITCFLAGGISGCPDWQKEVIKELEKLNPEHLVILNPRCDNFDINDKNVTEKQVKWEFKQLERMDIFSMYFVNSESVQPICMYELGRHLSRMPHRFLRDWRERVIIGVENGYKRTEDVILQSELALNGIYYRLNTSPKEHAKRIYNAYKIIIDAQQ